MLNRQNLKTFLTHKIDAEAEKFVSEADLSEYNFYNLKPINSGFKERNVSFELHLP